MKVIIAGGRNYDLTLKDLAKVESLNITEVVSGGASGVDKCGEVFAAMNGIPCKIFRADWNKHGRAAGPIRNREMAEYADAAVLFPGGRGTQSMKREAERAGIVVYDYMYE